MAFSSVYITILEIRIKIMPKIISMIDKAMWMPPNSMKQKI